MMSTFYLHFRLHKEVHILQSLSYYTYLVHHEGSWTSCLGCWSYLHPNRGHSSILKRLQQSDPVYSMGLDVMRPTYNLEPKYRVTMLNRENWTRGSGATPEVKGLVWYTDRSRVKEGTGTGVFG